MHRQIFLQAFCFVQLFGLTLGSSGSTPYGLESRAPIGRFLNNGVPPILPQAQWAAVKAFPNLIFPDPLGLVQAPGTHRFYVNCRQGQIYVFDNNPNATDKTLFLDLSARTQGWDDCGMMGLAFHPEFGRASSSNRGYFYVFYQYSPNPTAGPGRPPRTTPSYNRLSRFTVPDGATVADPASELVLIDQYDEDVWHNGGSMFFHPEDGFLYLTLGDEGGLDAQYGNTQIINKDLFSGVIRIDVNNDPTKSHPIRRQPLTEGTQPLSRTANYSIPNDNPFLDPNGGVLEEFYSIGLRSPHRMSYDPGDKKIWVSETGSYLREEIDVIEKGGNYQWGYKEGSLAGSTPRPAAIIGTEKSPIFEYGRDQGNITVIGGSVYRGRAYAAELGGKYVFGDNGSGRIFALTLNSNAPPTLTYLCNLPGSGYTGLASFGLDESNELFMVQMGQNGQIYKLIRPTESVPPPPNLLSQTGAFSDTPNLTPAAGLIPYEVNSPLWSDGARKQRWMALPNDGFPYSTDEQVFFSQNNEWLFPEGTVFVKHFDLALDDTNPNVHRRLETRLLVRNPEGALYGITYKWRPDNSDADLLEGALTEELTIKLGPPVGNLTSIDIGGPMPGSTTYDANSGLYTVTAGGADIWGNEDQFRFLYQERNGDFDVSMRIESLELVDGYTKAGLMARQSLAANSRHVNANAFADNRPHGNNDGGFEFIYRAATGGASGALDFTSPRVEYPNTWLRLKREGNQFTAYAGSNGVSWTKFAVYTLALPSNVFFGIAITSHDNTMTTTGRFRDLANNRGQAHYYPSRQDCITCHSPIAQHILGVRTHQLNGSYTYPGTAIADNQLRTWNHLGLFNPSINEAEIGNFHRLVSVTNSNASLEERARSYLAANCAQCHRPNGVARANWDARYETPLLLQNIVNGAITEPLGIAGARVVAPATLAKSILHRRINTVDATKMPPLARLRIDAAAVGVIGEWINSLPQLESTRGLRGEYYDNVDLTGLKLTRTDEVINFDWGQGSPDPVIGPDTFSVRWTGLIQPRFSEPYTFYTTSDDGVRLWVNGQFIINNWILHPATEDTGTVALSAGQKYELRMEYFEDGGLAVAKLAWSSPSQPKELIPPGQFSPSVGSWLDRDVGGVGIAGSATSSNQNFSVAASGADIWDYADAFHFVYRSLNGDGQIVARVASLENTAGWAKAGVMIRENLEADSTHAMMVITHAQGAAFQRRITQGGVTLHTPGPAVTTPYWVKLVRTGHDFTGSISSNGVNWIVVGTETIPMRAGALVGLAVTAHNNAVLNTATFSDVAVALSNFSAPVITLIERLGGNQVRLMITRSNTGSFAVEASSDFIDWRTVTTLIGTNATLEFIDTLTTDRDSRFYRVAGEP